MSESNVPSESNGANASSGMDGTSVWDSIVGQKPVIDMLSQVVRNPAAIAQSWLIAGAPGSGRSNVARAFAAALECPNHGDGTCKSCRMVLDGSHPDVTVVTTQKVTITIDEVRGLVEESEQMPQVSPWRIFIIEDFDRMTERTTNVLLKEIEEPAAHTIWLLCAPSPQDVLPTIRSRARLVSLAVPSHEAVADYLTSAPGGGFEAALASQAARLSQGHIGLAKMYATHPQVLHDRTALVGRVLSMRRASDGILLADSIVSTAGKQAADEVDESIAAAQEEFRHESGLGPKDAIPAAIRHEYNAIGKADEKKRLVTRRTRDVLDRALTDIASVYRDISVVRSGAADVAGLVNLENREALIDLSVHLSAQDTVERSAAIELARRRLMGGVAPLLTFEALLTALV
jgi:DNA polymerase-3 subunit delta'